MNILSNQRGCQQWKRKKDNAAKYVAEEEAASGIEARSEEEMDEDDLDMEKIDESVVDMSWDEIFEKVSKSSDAHVLKLAYTASELYRNYKNPLLKVAALQRL